jgi:hypothetical protein
VRRRWRRRRASCASWWKDCSAPQRSAPRGMG